MSGHAAAADAPFEERHWIEQFGVGIEVLIGVVALLTALIGVPVAWMKIRQTRATIRKMDLEARQIETQLAGAAGGESAMPDEGIRINIDGANNTVAILADPRLAGPLLIVIDFVIAWIILTLLSYGLQFVPSGLVLPFFKDALRLAVGLALLIPIIQDARKVRKALRSRLAAAGEAAPDEPASGS